MAKYRSTGGQGFWLTAGEVVGALALIIAGLNLWESHQQRVEAAQRVAGEDQARTAFVAQGYVERQGRALVIAPLSSAQAITSQSYIFPSAIQPSAEDVSASQPRIDSEWVASGLLHFLATKHLKGAGRARLPVVIETKFVEDGDTRSDSSLYELGVEWRPRFLGGEQIRLEGLALVRRGIGGDEHKLVDGVWTRDLTRYRPR